MADLNVNIKAVDQTKRGIRQANRNFDGLKRNILTVAQTATFAALGIASIGLAATTGFIVGGIKNIVDLSAAVFRLSEVTGVTTEFISRLDFIGREFGGTFESTASVINTVAQNLHQLALGEAPAFARNLALIGLSARDFIGLGTEEAILRITDALGREEDQTRRLGLARALLGAGADPLVPLLDGGITDDLNAPEARIGSIPADVGFEAHATINDIRLGKAVLDRGFAELVGDTLTFSGALDFGRFVATGGGAFGERLSELLRGGAKELVFDSALHVTKITGLLADAANDPITVFATGSITGIGIAPSAQEELLTLQNQGGVIAYETELTEAAKQLLPSLLSQRGLIVYDVRYNYPEGPTPKVGPTLPGGPSFAGAAGSPRGGVALTGAAGDISARAAQGDFAHDTRITSGVNGVTGETNEFFVPSAKGGITRGPTRALIGEAGQEALIPLDRLGALGGGDTYITYNISGSVLSERELDRRSTRANKRAAGRRTGSF